MSVSETSQSGDAVQEAGGVQRKAPPTMENLAAHLKANPLAAPAPGAGQIARYREFAEKMSDGQAKEMSGWVNFVYEMNEVYWSQTMPDTPEVEEHKDEDEDDDEHHEIHRDHEREGASEQ